ncbi:hypothetical protein LRS74_28820 [Streptomyces sp. LX-29]|uniref:hypothetical protein n=1 Tax=Streptomyces sp. LX-29 TaxID=2900152 RepID=UPI00240E453E|nr:hypothetical protein [Streptomyces sp. LX-29]WFB10593.1 hypothetical protein LRS74_28820 [Streptomyces sp. LX-29]
MTYHLAALRLHSIGERSARFTDVTLDLTAPHGVLAVPSDSIVWLRNGGGKSSLLSLFYTLMLPRATDFMGRVVKRSLTDYVDSGDTSHTVAVWYPATSQTLDGQPDHVLVTGAVYEWVDLRRPADADRARDKLETTFYAFYAVPGVIDLERLPISDETGAPRRRATFIAKLKEVAALHPQAMDLVTTERQHEWTTQLANRGLDPSLFRTQKQMNHVEGGVDELFKFASAREFIDLLIDLTVSPDDAANVAERLSSIASLLATKPAKEAEREFCLDVATGLERVTIAQREMDDSQQSLEYLVREGEALAAAFRATIAESQRHQETLVEHKARAEARKSAADTERGVAYDLVYLYEKRAAELRITHAEERRRQADQAAADAADHVAAWEAGEHLAAKIEAAYALDLTQKEAAAERAHSAPQRREHDEHTARLRRRLSHLAEEHHTRATTATEARTAAVTEREGLVEQATTVRSAAAAADSDIAKARAHLEGLAADLRSAARDGALPTETTDPAAHDAELEQRLDALGRDAKDIRERRARRPEARTELTKKLAALTAERTRLDSDRTALTAEHAALSQRATELAAIRRIRDLIEATDDSPADLWAETETLTRRLTNAILETDLELVRLEAEHLDDKRVLDVHTRTGLLPTTRDAERVQTTLAEHGITAETGWQHLRTLLPDFRLADALTDRHLSRIGVGLVIASDQEEAATSVLASVDAATTALVGVYTSHAASAVAARGPHPSACGVPGPAWSGLHPGLIDPTSTDTTIRQVTSRTETHAARQAALTEARTGDRGLLDAVTSLVADCPAGHLTALQSRIDELDQAISAHDTALGNAQRSLEALDRAEAEDAARQETTQDEITRVVKIRAKLGGLIKRAEAASTWRQDLSDAEARSIAAHDHERKLVEQANAAFEAGIQSKALAEKEQAIGDSLRREAGALTYLDTEPAVDDDPRISLEALRKRHQDAQRAWHVRAAQSVLAERERTLTDVLAKENATLATIPQNIQQQAAELLRTANGQTAQQRAAALTDARTAEREALDRRGRAAAAVERHTGALKTIEERRAEAPRRTLPTEPTSAEHADSLAAEQEQAGQSAIERRATAEREISDLDKKNTELEGVISLFGLLTDGLPEPHQTPAAPFTGNGTQAQQRKRDITERIRAAEHGSAEAAAHRTKAVAALRTLGARYPTVATPAKDRILHDGEEILARNASHLANQLTLRGDMIDGELAGIAKDQEIVTDSLARLVSHTLDTLRKAERYSRVNTQNGGWAGKRMLRISFDAPASDADLRTYVNRVIERRVAQGVKPEGLPLLKEAVHEAVGPRGFTVKVLKPSRDTVATTEDITRLGKWSGGEKLTVCVALYCTIAALRAANAGRKDRSGGILLLDNPIGRASHGDLVRLQRAVAAAHKVQLVYTTGVKDPNAISLFPNVVRLDNRPGRTHNRRYVVPDSSAVSEEAVRGFITGARVAHDEAVGTDGETR